MKAVFGTMLVAAWAAALTGCVGHSDVDQAHNVTSQPHGPDVSTTTVKTEAVPITASGYGSVQGGPNAQASLAFAQPGRILRVYVSVGEHVSAGQSLAQLDPGPFQAAVDQASGQLAAAQANYQRVAAGARPQQIAQTDAQIQGAQTAVSTARAQLQREQQLLQLGVSSQSDVDGAKNALAAAQTQLHVYEQQGIAQRQPWAPDVAEAHANVSQATAALAASRRNLDYATMNAPFSGVVIARLHNDGETVDQTMPVIELAEFRNVVFTAQFRPQDAVKIQLRDSATVEAQGGYATATGSVVAMNPSQDNDAKSIGVLIRLNGGGMAFGPGASGKATVIVGTKSGLVVPASALVSDPTTGSTQVFVRNGKGQFSPVQVVVKQTFGTKAWVESGDLRPGDIIAARGALELQAPAQLRPNEPDTH